MQPIRHFVWQPIASGHGVDRYLTYYYADDTDDTDAPINNTLCGSWNRSLDQPHGTQTPNRVTCLSCAKRMPAIGQSIDWLAYALGFELGTFDPTLDDLDHTEV